ncbi:MAG: hypothetical protein J5966_07550 [Lachnospiraceae bacterium]|nr:hypothetical protein [Lachnospiraceae bacterium]
MDKRFAIPDEELNQVSGGIIVTSGIADDPQAGGHCPNCTALMNKTATGYVCPDCGAVFDKNGKQISGAASERLAKRVGGSSFGRDFKKS